MQTWNIDSSHSAIRFSVRHLMFAKVHGSFGVFNGTLEFDEAKNEFTKVRAEIDTGSVDTREAKRDAHLKSADFFDAEKHPKMIFESTRIEKAPGKSDGYVLQGDLTIRGIKQPIALEVESLGRAKDPWGNTRVAFTAKGSIADRKTYGLKWNQALETGGFVVGDKIDLELEVQAIAPQASKTTSTESTASASAS